MEIKKSSKIPHIFCCELCDYFTSYSKDYKKHLNTKKHMEMDGNIKEMKKVLICKNCEKEFRTNAGLWKHKQKCNQEESKHETNKKLTELDKDELIITLLKQNAELIKGQQDMMIKLTENGITNSTTNNINTNNFIFDSQQEGLIILFLVWRVLIFLQD